MRGNKYEGMRNGMLVAIKNLGTKYSSSGRPYCIWLFKCDCGNEKELCPNDVFKKRKNPKINGVKSCGCNTKNLMSKAKRKPEGEAALNGLYASYRRACAENRNLNFDLTLKDFKRITGSTCYYCGLPPRQIKRAKFSNYNYNGIDRVDNEKGYSLDNVVAACKDCNSLKSGVTIHIAHKMLEFLDKK